MSSWRSVPLLSARGLVKSFGGRRILDGLDLELAAGARIGVLGPNGGGKSTLLRILSGREYADAGDVTRRRGLVDAFLPQEVAGDERTPLATVLSARPELAELEAELAAAEARLADPALADDLDAMTRALARQERLLGRWSDLGGDRAEGEARMHLRELGVAGEALERPTRELSGGQRKLVALAACLARRPDVLLLDEPEAHLDMRRRDQLERLVSEFPGAVLMVSHDRHLLDECVSAIAEVDRGRVRIWPGAYSAYVAARALELERQKQSYVTQQKEIARLEEAIRRFRHWAHIVVDKRHATRANNAQRRIDRMEKVERPVIERRKMALQLRSGVRGGQRVLALEGVDFSFGDDPVLLDVDLVVTRGERVGVVGPNGAGKTVLVRLLAGELEPDGRHALGRRGDRGRLPLPGRRRARPVGDAGRRAARRPLAGRGRGRPAADGLPVRLRAGSPPGGDAQRRRAHAARVPPADAGPAELPRARRADQPPRRRLDRGPRGRAGALRRHRRGGLPRPLLPRPHRRPDRARGRRLGARVRGRLVGEPALAGA